MSEKKPAGKKPKLPKFDVGKTLSGIDFRFSKTHVTKIQALADIQLIIGCPMAVILPLIGFVAACILVRYKKEYRECV